jgi:glycine cleavage system H protein
MKTHDTFKFAQTHEWASLEDNGLVWVGISNHAQDALGDVMFFQAPKLGQSVRQGEPLETIESVKAASDIHAPISGEIIALNDVMDSNPENINENPYGIWLLQIKPSSKESLAIDFERLISFQEYSSSNGA